MYVCFYYVLYGCWTLRMRILYFYTKYIIFDHKRIYYIYKLDFILYVLIKEKIY